jgi:galactokinase
MPIPSPQLTDSFQRTFGTQPDFYVRAPGRVDLIGTHTDYNEGFVLPAAIDRSTWLAVQGIDQPQATFHALDMGGEQVTLKYADLKIPAADDQPGWARYPAGVAWSLAQEGIPLRGIRAVLGGDVPVGAGLSSSASVETACGLMWSHLAGLPLDRMKLAKVCQRAENEYVGVNSGLMDPFASLHGQANHALLFDCRSLDWEALPLPAGVALVIADTGKRRELAHSAYNQRRAECDQALASLKQVLPGITALRDVSMEAYQEFRNVIPEPARYRAAHVISENARVLAAADALRHTDGLRLGQLLDESHISSRDMFEASGPELDAMWKASHGIPARLGGRFAGAGWAGCMVFAVQSEGTQDFINTLSGWYHTNTGLQPALYPIHAADGAQVIIL